MLIAVLVAPSTAWAATPVATPSSTTINGVKYTINAQGVITPPPPFGTTCSYGYPDDPIHCTAVTPLTHAQQLAIAKTLPACTPARVKLDTTYDPTRHGKFGVTTMCNRVGPVGSATNPSEMLEGVAYIHSGSTTSPVNQTGVGSTHAQACLAGDCVNVTATFLSSCPGGLPQLSAVMPSCPSTTVPKTGPPVQKTPTNSPSMALSNFHFSDCCTIAILLLLILIALLLTTISMLSRFRREYRHDRELDAKAALDAPGKNTDKKGEENV